MTKQQAIENACKLIDLAWIIIDPAGITSCDCFCGKSQRDDDPTFSSSSTVFIWIREAIIEKAERENRKITTFHEAFDI